MTSPSPTRVDTAPQPGLLRVEVPHWAAQLNIFNSQGQLTLRPDQLLVQAQTSEGTGGTWLAEAELAPGVYEVELSLEGQTARQLAIVREKDTCVLTQDSWNQFELRLTSAMPLSAGLFKQGNLMQDAQCKAAQVWSRKLTWPRSSGGSRLFVFIRTANRQKGGRFFDNLALLDDRERVITTFSEHVRVSEKEGWLAFTANLPAGYYLLKRQRYDQYRTKYQPLYLCDGWETQAFLLASKRPSLQTLAMNMAPIATGFQPDDEAAGAASILLNSLRKSVNPDRLVTLRAVQTLLGSRTDNPWLTILSAYIIRLQQDQLLGDDLPSGVWPTLRDSWPDLMMKLTALEAHPDVQALQLDMDKPAGRPILYPPLLYAGLRRVQQHALQHADTVPVDSLLKRVLPRVSTTSVWTAWRQTSQPAQAPTRVARARRSLREADVLADPAESPLAPAISSVTPDYLRSVSPKLPVYQMQTGTATVQDAYGQLGGPAGEQAVSNVLLNVLALQTAQNLSAVDLRDIPNTTQLNAKADISEIVNPDHASAISKASGVPLGQVQSSLNKLQYTFQQADKPEKTLTAYDRTVFDYAVQRSIETTADSPLLITIEECIHKLLTESNRLAAQFTDGALAPAINRINRLVDQLLSSARFIVLTDVDGKVLLTNGAFVILLKKELPLDNSALNEWQTFFKTAPFGHTRLPYHLVNKGTDTWELQRTVLHDNDHNQAVYLNMFQNGDGLRLTENQLAQFERLLPGLVLATSSIAYNQSGPAQWTQPTSAQHQPTQKLDEILGQMEQVLAKPE